MKHVVGTTASGSGFYGCQGRSVGQFRGRLTVPNLVDELGSIGFPPVGKAKEKVVNIEMENSAVLPEQHPWLQGWNDLRSRGTPRG